MKNNLYKILCFALVLLTIQSCEKDRRFVEFEDLEYGAIARIIDGVNVAGNADGDAWDFNNIENSTVGFTVEMYDENNGQNVESYTWTAAYRDRGPVQIASFSRSDFSAGALGLPTLTVNWNMSDIMDALGLVQDSLVFGFNFDLQAEITKTDGSVFNSSNTQANVQGQPLFRGLMQMAIGVDNIPILVTFRSDLAGFMTATTICTDQGAGIGWDQCGADMATWSGDMEWLQEHTDPDGPGLYNFTTTDADAGTTNVDASMGAYYPCYGADQGALPNGDLRLIDTDGKLEWSGVSQWDESYVIDNVETNGTVLTFEWANDYGEGATSDIVRVDGEDWPELTN